MEQARSEWEEWRAVRHKALTNPRGNLALVQTVWVPGGDNEAALAEVLRDAPSTISGTTIERHDFDGNLLESGYRLWDADSEAINAFVSMSSYDYDPAWVISGTFRPQSAPAPVPFEFSQPGAGVRDLAVSGDIEVTIGGEDYRLTAFDNDGLLQLVFLDPTATAGETYPTGRFLFIRRNADSDQVVLDFNRAVVPPCGFSVHFNCPLPPAPNRLRVPVTAGERFPVFTNGYSIH